MSWTAPADTAALPVATDDVRWFAGEADPADEADRTVQADTRAGPDATHQHPVATLHPLAEHLVEVPRVLQSVAFPVPRTLHHERLPPKVETARDDPPGGHRPLRLLEAVHRAGRDLEPMRGRVWASAADAGSTSHISPPTKIATR